MDKIYLNRPDRKSSILLLGNGINRLFNGDSWEKTISGQCGKYGVVYDKNLFEAIPFNMQIIAATNDNVDVSMKSLCADLKDISINDENKAFIRKLLELPFNDILTCNYTYELEKTILEKKAYHPSSTNGKSGVENMMIFNPIIMDHNDKQKNIWHIHGHIGAPNSVIMGQYFYGNLLSKIQAYVPEFIRRYKGSAAFGKCTAKSWVDHFLTSDVHILGLGMDFSEMDLWWLACCKKRNFSSTKIYFYEAAEDLSPAKKAIMNAYGIETPEFHTNGSDYYSCYLEMIRAIRDNLADMEI